MLRSNFTIRSIDRDRVVIRDDGPWNKYQTVTNDAENVVAHLYENNVIKNGTRLFYYDSDSEMDELLHENGVFIGFGG